MKLKKEEFDNELSYLVSIYILDDLVERFHIDQKDYQLIKKTLLKHYRPLISSLMEGYDAS